MSAKLDYTQFIGNIYGRLEVIGIGQTHTYKGHIKQQLLCLCECGNPTYVVYDNLRYDNTKSCGCFRVSTAEKHMKSIQPKGMIKRRLPKGIAERNRIYYSYKKGARRRGYCFELSVEQFEFITKKNCHYCGEAPKELNIRNRSHYGCYTGNGIDRKDNAVGYTIENCLPCCKMCNRAKLDVSYKEYQQQCLRVVQHSTKYPRAS